MILSRYTIILLMYPDPEQLKEMIHILKKYNDFEFMDLARTHFINIQLIRKGVYAV